MDRQGHIKPIKVHQGHIFLGMIEIGGHGTSQGMSRPGHLMRQICPSKGHMTKGLILHESSLHPRQGREVVALNVVSWVATQTSTGVWLGI